jgi:hypothetical protein
MEDARTVLGEEVVPAAAWAGTAGADGLETRPAKKAIAATRARITGMNRFFLALSFE